MPTYDLNVSRNGMHYCRIALPGDLTDAQAIARGRKIAMALRSAFPHGTDVLKFDLLRWSVPYGTPLDLEAELVA